MLSLDITEWDITRGYYISNNLLITPITLKKLTKSLTILQNPENDPNSYFNTKSNSKLISN